MQASPLGKESSSEFGVDFDPLAPAATVYDSGRTNTAYWCCVVLGSGVVFPWNSWILAYRYFDVVFGADRYVEYSFTLCYYLPAVLAILAMLRSGERVSIRARIQVAFGRG